MKSRRLIESVIGHAVTRKLRQLLLARLTDYSYEKLPRETRKSLTHRTSQGFVQSVEILNHIQFDRNTPDAKENAWALDHSSKFTVRISNIDPGNSGNTLWDKKYLLNANLVSVADEVAKTARQLLISEPGMRRLRQDLDDLRRDIEDEGPNDPNSEPPF